jgi:hypothetical protein
MRYAIYLLIVMNFVYFTWHVFQDVPENRIIRVPSLLPLDIRQLVTIQERNAQQSPEVTRSIEEVTVTQPPGAVMPLFCQAFGPFATESELKVIENRLNKLGLATKPRTRYIQERVGYTVLLPAMEYEEALQIKRRLDQENITPNFIDKHNVISLGSFKEKSQAEKKLTSARALGLDPHLEPSYAKRSTYWLGFQEQNNKKTGLAEFMKKHPDQRLEEIACE